MENYKSTTNSWFTTRKDNFMGKIEKCSRLYMIVTGILIACFLSSCSKDDGETTDSGSEINVVVDNNGVANAGHSFTRIDDKNFYIDDIKYTIVDSILEVTGYDETFFKGEAKLISSLDYHGSHFNVKNIASDAFYSCKTLTAIVIPNGVVKIGNSAFKNCVHLESATIGNSVTEISGGVFSGCTSLSSIRIAGGNPKYDSRSNCNAIIETSSNCLIVGCKNTVIPSSVTSIGNYAFYDCTSITDFSIPENITSIGNYSFAGCSHLTFISIGNGVTSIGEYAFSGCTNLSAITLPENLTAIGKLAFQDCKALASITIPSKVTEIRYAFSGCSNLSVTICTPIVKDGWLYETPIKELQIGDETTIIEKHAFWGCSELTKVSIGKNIKTIEYGAFYKCLKVRDFYCYSESVPEATEGFSAMEMTLSGDFITYRFNFREATLHVPSTSISDYQNVQPWKFFGNIVAL